MKKLLIALLVLIAAYLVGAAVLAVANGQAEGKVVLAEKQLLVDGDMEAAGVVGWWTVDIGNASKVSGSAVDGKQVLRIGGSGAEIARTKNANNPFTVGKSYRITGWARGDGTAAPRVGRISTAWWTGTPSTSWQRFDFIYVATQTIFEVERSAVAGGYAEFDDVTVTEYSGKTTVADQQLLVDGDMEESGVSNWGTIIPGILTKQNGGAKDGKQVLRIAFLSSNYPVYTQQILTAGKMYRVTGWMRGDGVNGLPRVKLGSSVGVALLGTTSTAWQRIDFTGVPGNVHFIVQNWTTLDGYAEFDDVMVTEYTGKIKDPYKQLLTDGDMEAPPTLVANGLADNDMENAGTTDWAVVSGATLSKETGSPHGGSQVLRVVEDSGYGSARPAVSPVVTGTTYIVRGYARSDGTRYPILSQEFIGDTWGGTTDTDWQYFSVLYESTIDYIYFGLKSTGAPGGYVEFDDITVQEVTDAGTSAWTAGNDAVLTKEPGAANEGDLTLRVSFNGTNHPNARQSVLTVGGRYRITGWARGDGASAYPQVLNGAAGEWTGTVSTDWQRVDAVFTADDTYVRLKTSAYAQGYSEWDDVFVTEL